MAFDELEFEVVVQVLNVVGYEFLNDQILLRFTLDGMSQQTGNILAKSDKVAVNTNLSWTTTKAEIKRMKAENLPIRVECFRVKDEHESIGFVLIPLRIIPTFLYKNDLLPSPRWYKFMGVHDNIFHNKPELHVNVIIQPESECLASTHLRGQIDGDESYAEPDIANHFEIKLDTAANITNSITPVVEDVITLTIPVTEDATKQKKTTYSQQQETDKYVQKLEDWKNEEKDNFLSHLKKVENTFLASMFEEWQRKKHEEENKLKWTIEECERLSTKLEDGYAQMKEFREKDLQIASAIEVERTRNDALENELREERKENNSLRSRVMEFEKAQESIQQLIKETEQLNASLAKLKLSKDYYKQKWVQLIREVNKLDK